MILDLNPERKLKFNPFSRLGLWYFLALSLIAAIAISGQVLIQQHLHDQIHDSHIINLAGTQRYKSQQVVKMALLLYHENDTADTRPLQDSLEAWRINYRGLQQRAFGISPDNSEKISAMFNDTEPYFQNIYKSITGIIRSKKTRDTNQLQEAMRTLHDNETVFLKKMDLLVLQYDREARQKVSMLSMLEYILLAISILVILLEILFVFRPIATRINRTIRQLMESEKNARKLSKEIGALYTSLENSYEKLSIVNQPPDNPRLYAKTDKGGNVIFVAEAFTALSGIRSFLSSTRLSDIFPGMNNPDDWMDKIIDVVSEGGTWQGELQFESLDKKQKWADVIITPVYHDGDRVEELVVMGSDITKRKEAEKNMGRKNRAEIEKKINQQKFRSVLILEGQEEERKRIAMDIHDGIGQMLTSLKFQIGSIDLKESEKAEKKIKEVEQGIKEVIREVRKVTFNLKPTVLGDYGLQAALNVFVQEIGKLTDTQLVFRTSGEIERLPQKTENNIFRIIQEAINNAIKYSGADAIFIDLIQSENELAITVQDQGKGFDIKLAEARNINIESGRGFFNMYERTEYVNGNLAIDSKPGKGTTVVLTVPMRSAVTTGE